MFLQLDSGLELTTLVLFFPIVFLIHDLEEVFTVQGFILKNKQRIEDLLPKRIVNILVKQFSMTTSQFAIAVAIIFIMVIYATYNQYRFIKENQYSSLFIIAMIIFFVHAFTHIGQAVILKSYTPGVFSSLLIVIPYSGYVFYRLFEVHFINWDTILIHIPYTLLILPFVLGAHALSRKIVRGNN